MSRRAAKKAKRSEMAEAEVKSSRARRLIRRKKVTILALVSFGAVFLIAYATANREPRVTLRNKTGGPVTEIRLIYPGGESKVDSLAEGGHVTLDLKPDKPDAPPGPMVLSCRLPDGSLSRTIGKPIERGLSAHQIYTADRLATGAYLVKKEGDEAGPVAPVRGLLRRIGLDF